jgi:hypothetical protein
VNEPAALLVWYSVLPSAERILTRTVYGPVVALLGTFQLNLYDRVWPTEKLCLSQYVAVEVK